MNGKFSNISLVNYFCAYLIADNRAYRVYFHSFDKLKEETTEISLNIPLVDIEYNQVPAVLPKFGFLLVEDLVVSSDEKTTIKHTSFFQQLSII